AWGTRFHVIAYGLECHRSRGGSAVHRDFPGRLLRAQHHESRPPGAVHQPIEVLDCRTGHRRLPNHCGLAHHRRFLGVPIHASAVLRPCPGQGELLRGGRSQS
ncbi:unnamed protein product, partial [Symbiodinium microadriaticum]